MLKKAGLLVLIVFVAGCTTEADYKEREKQIQNKELEYARFSAPANAENLRSLGRGWYTFSLTTEGKTRHFLWRRPDLGYSSTECITELSQ